VVGIVAAERPPTPLGFAKREDSTLPRQRQVSVAARAQTSADPPAFQRLAPTLEREVKYAR
jgi:hypothetical protein